MQPAVHKLLSFPDAIVRVARVSMLSVCRSLRELRRELHRQREWRTELERLRAGAAVGCLHVESRTLGAALLPAMLAAAEQVRNADAASPS